MGNASVPTTNELSVDLRLLCKLETVVRKGFLFAFTAVYVIKVVSETCRYVITCDTVIYRYQYQHWLGVVKRQGNASNRISADLSNPTLKFLTSAQI